MKQTPFDCVTQQKSELIYRYFFTECKEAIRINKFKIWENFEKSPKKRYDEKKPFLNCVFDT